MQQATPTNIIQPADMQQTRDVSMATLSIGEELKQRRTAAIERNKDLPKKYKGYEYLLEIPDDDQYYDGPPVPTGITYNICHTCYVLYV